MIVPLKCHVSDDIFRRVSALCGEETALNLLCSEDVELAREVKLVVDIILGRETINAASG